MIMSMRSKSPEIKSSQIYLEAAGLIYPITINWKVNGIHERNIILLKKPVKYFLNSIKMTSKFGGLKIQKKTAKRQTKSIFTDDLEQSDNEDSDSEQVGTLLKRPLRKLPISENTDDYNNDVNSVIRAQNRRNQQQAAALQAQDPSVYAYDDVYDDMKAADQAVRHERAKDKKGESKYMNLLQSSVKKREQDRLLAHDSISKRTRDEEGDEFAGALVFESKAFKKQKAELELAQKEEERKEEQEREKDAKTGGGALRGLYNQMLQQSEQRHAAQTRATERKIDKKI
ncbi:coiled-coil domain-containing protein 55-domain containing protein [Lipomyces oligophaga]|uniref:coiled-coil domain-containing protein 55-domain containing protein n=1 Tax=Lipomyces oligophaga TaxID=45792 RepID=UPI0034CF63D3